MKLLGIIYSLQISQSFHCAPPQPLIARRKVKQVKTKKIEKEEKYKYCNQKTFLPVKCVQTNTAYTK